MLTGIAFALFADLSVAETDFAELTAKLATAIPGIKSSDLRTTPAPGLYEVRVGNHRGYVTADGKFLIRGDLFEIATLSNLTEQGRQTERREALASLDPAESIRFAPAHPKHTISVFTDVDCAYCRKFHSEIAKYNELGIAINYYSFPRSGPATESWSKAEAVWCAPDRKEALTHAKLGAAMPKPAACETKAVAQQFEVGRTLGVEGTPTLIAEDGSILGGYVPAQQLAQKLDQLATAKTARR
jgi:thiol:disulfide interchange protein DsbC